MTEIEIETDSDRNPKKNKSARPKRVRLSPQQREQMILDAAIEFFAEHGFSAQTRHLADKIGVSQSLIFRYFGTKGALIERVYQKIFLSRWNPEWERMLSDTSQPVRARLKAFYRSYIAAVDDRHWIRIAMYSSLAGNDLTRRYIQNHVNGLMRLVAKGLRELTSGEDGDITPSSHELERAWYFQSILIYYLIRKHIHQTVPELSSEELVEALVNDLLDGVSRRIL